MRKLSGKFMRLLCLLLFLTASAIAADPGPFLGKWGTEAQCSGELITTKGTKRAEPFDIRPDWLGHGDVWCRLSWGAAAPAENGHFAVARALCGEDAVRDYELRFRLNGDQLTLSWNLLFNNGPLMRCEM